MRRLSTFLMLAPLLTVAVACSGSDSNGDTTGTSAAVRTTTAAQRTTTAPGTTTTTVPTTTSEEPPRLGATVDADGVRYEVVDAITSPRLSTDLPSGGAAFALNVIRKGVRYGAKARGVYIVVHVKHTGARRQFRDYQLSVPPAARVPASKLKDVTEDLVDGRGKLRSAAGFNVAFQAKPEATTELRAAYDVPPAAVEGSRLRIRIGGTTKTIDLGLD